MQRRDIFGYNAIDPSSIENNEYNNAAGSKKVSEVGRHLLPFPTPGAGTGYTTNLTTAFPLPYAGACLAIYNNNAALGSVTLGSDNTVTSLAPGVTDTSGRVGIPCLPNAWTYIACGYQNWAISSAATLLVFLINDNSSIRNQ